MAPTEVFCECAESTNTSLRCFRIGQKFSNRLIFFLLTASVKCELPAVLMDEGPVVKYDIA